MNLEYRVKFRAFGITFGTVKGAQDITDVVVAIVKIIFTKANTPVPSFLASIIAGVKFPTTVLVDERGVYIALAPKPVEP